MDVNLKVIREGATPLKYHQSTQYVKGAHPLLKNIKLYSKGGPQISVLEKNI